MRQDKTGKSEHAGKIVLPISNPRSLSIVDFAISLLHS